MPYVRIKAPLKAFRALKHIDMSLRQHEASKNEINRVVDDGLCKISHVSQEESPKSDLVVDGTVYRHPTESQPAFSPTISGWQLKIIVFSYVGIELQYFNSMCRLISAAIPKTLSRPAALDA